MSLLLLERSVLPYWVRFRMHKAGMRLGEKNAQPGAAAPTQSLIIQNLIVALFIGLSCFGLLSCSSKPDPNTLVMIIESSPTNLDPRVGVDAVSERIDSLIFDDLLNRDGHLNVKPAL